MTVENHRILVSDPKAQYLAHSREIQSAIARVLESGWYILGEEVRCFEGEFAEFIGVSECIGVANGTDALAIALRACGVASGDEVITVAHSAVATVAAIEQIGAVPVFCDIDPESRCLNPGRLPALITDRTRAVIPVHIFGHPADMEAIMAISKRFGVSVVEDCAQAHGADINGRRVGSFGDVAAFSFYPTKNLGAIGDGGGIVTDNHKLADRVRMLRQYGWRERYLSSVAGVNSRLDEIQAAILREKLRFLVRDNARRNEIADMYDQGFADTPIKCPVRPFGLTHAMHLYVIEHPQRDDLRAYLDQHGIQAAIHYPVAIHKQDAYRDRALRGGDQLFETDGLYQRILSLPIYPELTDKEVQTVIQTVREWLNGKG